MHTNFDCEIGSKLEGTHKTINRIKRAYQRLSCDTCAHALWIQDIPNGIWLRVEDCNLEYPGVLDEILDSNVLEELAYACGRWAYDFELIQLL